MPMLFRSMIERWWPRSKKSVPPDLKSPATRSRADRFRLKRWNWSPIRQDYSLRTASSRLAVWHPGMPIILNWPWSRFARDSQNHWYTALSLFPYILLILLSAVSFILTLIYVGGAWPKLHRTLLRTRFCRETIFYWTLWSIMLSDCITLCKTIWNSFKEK